MTNNLKNLSNNKLYGLIKYFKDFDKLLQQDKLPKVLLLSGKRGQGKLTLIKHLLSSNLDKSNYEIDTNTVLEQNKFFYGFDNNIDPNIFYFNCSAKNIKIDEIRKLRTDLQKTSINESKRYIIFDDVEYLSENCVNALLKTIEEPTTTNCFILINNKTRFILDTLKSRSIEINVFLSNKERIQIIERLIIDFKIEIKIDYLNSSITPGDFLRYNEIAVEENIDFNEKLSSQINKLLKLYKLKKNINYLQYAFYLINQFFYENSNISNIEKMFEKRSHMVKKIDEANRLNLNHSNLILELERDL